MGYAEYVQFQVNNASKHKILTVKNSGLDWGKWYSYPNKDNEVGSPNDQTIQSGGTLSIASCGRENASSGTQGHFDLYDGDSRILTVNWDDPWANGATNTMTINNYLPDDWIASNSAFPSKGAELGTIAIKVAVIG